MSPTLRSVSRSVKLSGCCLAVRAGGDGGDVGPGMLGPARQTQDLRPQPVIIRPDRTLCKV